MQQSRVQRTTQQFDTKNGETHELGNYNGTHNYDGPRQKFYNTNPKYPVSNSKINEETSSTQIEVQHMSFHNQETLLGMAPVTPSSQSNINRDHRMPFKENQNRYRMDANTNPRRRNDHNFHRKENSAGDDRYNPRMNTVSNSTWKRNNFDKQSEYDMDDQHVSITNEYSSSGMLGGPQQNHGSSINSTNHRGDTRYRGLDGRRRQNTKAGQQKYRPESNQSVVHVPEKTTDTAPKEVNSSVSNFNPQAIEQWLNSRTSIIIQEHVMRQRQTEDDAHTNKYRFLELVSQNSPVQPQVLQERLAFLFEKACYDESQPPSYGFVPYTTDPAAGYNYSRQMINSQMMAQQRFPPLPPTYVTYAGQPFPVTQAPYPIPTENIVYYETAPPVNSGHSNMIPAKTPQQNQHCPPFDYVVLPQHRQPSNQQVMFLMPSASPLGVPTALVQPPMANPPEQLIKDPTVQITEETVMHS